MISEARCEGNESKLGRFAPSKLPNGMGAQLRAPLIEPQRYHDLPVPDGTSRLAVRGLLRELGIPSPLGARRVVPEVWALISDGDTPVPDSLRPALSEAAREITELEIRTRSVEEQLEALSRQSPLIAQRRTIPVWSRRCSVST